MDDDIRKLMDKVDELSRDPTNNRREHSLKQIATDEAVADQVAQRFPEDELQTVLLYLLRRVKNLELLQANTHAAMLNHRHGTEEEEE